MRIGTRFKKSARAVILFSILCDFIGLPSFSHRSATSRCPPSIRPCRGDRRLLQLTFVSDGSPEKVPELADRACQVWWAEVDRLASRCADLLSPAERARAASLPVAAEGRRFTVGRALVRTVLSGLTGRSPGELRFSRLCSYCGGPHGKPRLRVPGSRVYFNVSHSGDLVVAAFSRSADVGVDVEERQPGFDVGGGARFALSAAELSVLSSLPESRRGPAFFTYWARKEAVAKATGEGLRHGLRRIEVGHPEHPARLVAHPWRPAVTADLRLLDLDSGPSYASALCLLGRVDTVCNRDAGTLLASFARMR